MDTDRQWQGASVPLLSVILLTSCVALVSPAQAGIIQLTDDTMDDWAPQIDDGWVVWYGPDEEDPVPVGWPPYYAYVSHVYLYDGATTRRLGEEHVWAGGHSSPWVDGGRVAWTFRRREYGDWGPVWSKVYIWPSATGDPIWTGQAAAGQVRLDGDTVAWVADSRRIYLYHGAATTQVFEHPAGYESGSLRLCRGQMAWRSQPTFPSPEQRELWRYDGLQSRLLATRVYGMDFRDGLLVWSEWDGEDMEIWTHDGTSLRQLTDNDYNDGSPVTASGRVAWMGQAVAVWPYHYGQEIFVWDGGVTRRLTDDVEMDDYPAIDSEGRVAWAKCGEIYLFDGVVKRLTNNGPNGDPQIDGGCVVWRGYDGNDYEIFMYDPAIPEPPPPDLGALRANLHIHTDVSSDNPPGYRYESPGLTIESGRRFRLNVVGLSDHGEHINSDEWGDLKTASENASGGRFLALRGFEWSKNYFDLGLTALDMDHLNVFGSANWTGTEPRGDDGGGFEPEPDLPAFYDWLARQGPNGEAGTPVAQFNHPWLALRNFQGYALPQGPGADEARRRVALIEVGQNHILDLRPTDYDRALSRGWHVGPTMGNDNMGLLSPEVRRYHTGIWAAEASPASVMGALRDRRVFASEDEDASIDMADRFGNAVMGSRNCLPGRAYYIVYDDGGGEGAAVFVGTNLRQVLSAPSWVASGLRAPLYIPEELRTLDREAWFYVLLTQGDADKILSAPVWMQAHGATLVARLEGPVDAVVTAPDGSILSKEASEIPGATYEEGDFDDNGEKEDWIEVPAPADGPYRVTVSPEPDASAVATYSLEAGGIAGTFWVARGLPVSHLLGRAPATYTVMGSGEPAGLVISHEPVTHAWTNTPVLVSVVVAGRAQVADVAVVYEAEGDPWTDLPMDNEGPGFFTATIPGGSMTPTQLSYYIRVRDTDGGVVTDPALDPQSAPHVIAVELPPTLGSHELPAPGYYMISFPVEAGFATPHDLLCDDLGDGNYYMWRWDAGGYGNIPTAAPECHSALVSTQEGYWLLAQGATLDIDVAGLTPPSSDQAIPLRAGWNMIAAPYEVVLDSLLVDNAGEVRTLADAQSAGWVMGTFYYYHGTDTYRTVAVNRTPADQLRLWHGYWVLAGIDCWLMVPPPGGTQAAKTGEEPLAAPAWGFDIRASSGSSLDSVTIAAADSASDDFDGFAWDKPKPPSAPGEDRLRMVLREGWRGTETPPYNKAPGRQMPWASELATETKGTAQEDTEWELTVTGGVQGEPVTLTWPDLSQLPKDRVAMLTDRDAGKRSFMRSRAQYEFAAPGEGASRSFTVTVKPAQAGALLISGLTAAPTRGGTWDIGFNLSADAAVTGRVYNVAGRRVADIAQAQQLARGRASLVWDSRSIANTHVPSGVYLLRLTARTEEGEQASAVRMLQVRR